MAPLELEPELELDELEPDDDELLVLDAPAPEEEEELLEEPPLLDEPATPLEEEVPLVDPLLDDELVDELDVGADGSAISLPPPQPAIASNDVAARNFMKHVLLHRARVARRKSALDKPIVFSLWSGLFVLYRSA